MVVRGLLAARCVSFYQIVCLSVCPRASRWHLIGDSMADPEGDRDVGSEDEADGELKKAEDAYANECNAKPLNSRNMW